MGRRLRPLREWQLGVPSWTERRGYGARLSDNSQLLKPFSFIKNNVRSFFETGGELNNTRYRFPVATISRNSIFPTEMLEERRSHPEQQGCSAAKYLRPANEQYVRQVQHQHVIQLYQPEGRCTQYRTTGSGRGGLFQSLLQIPVDIPTGQKVSATTRTNSSIRMAISARMPKTPTLPPSRTAIRKPRTGSSAM